MRCFRVVRFFLVALLSLATFHGYAQRHATTITYVNLMASGANNGTSWSNAYNDLQTALNDPQATEIWVAQGIYTPQITASTNSQSFIVDGFGASGIVYGGFNGSETTLEQRNTTQNLTILERNGDISATDKSILAASSKSNDIIFDGFTFSTIISAEKEILTGEIIDIQVVNSWLGNTPIDNSSEFLSKSPNSNTLKRLPFSNDESLDSSDELEALQNTFSVFPTSTSSNITVQSKAPAIVEIINHLGRIVKTVQLTSSPATINVSTLPKGLYIVKIQNQANGVSTTRIIVE